MATKSTGQSTLPSALVTGGTGFVGRALVFELARRGVAVRVLAFPGDPLREPLIAELAGEGFEVEWTAGDVTDRASLEAAMDGVDAVFHVAAVVTGSAPWERFRAVNVGGTENVCAAAVSCAVPRTVVVSTSDVFGLPSGAETFDETSPYRAWGAPYPDTKIEAAQVVRRARDEQGLNASLVYPGWVYGPGDRSLLPAVAEMVRDGNAFTWGEGRSFELSLVYVEELVAGMVAVAEAEAAAGEDFLLLDDSSGVSVPEFYQLVARSLNADVRVRHLPMTLVMAAARAMEFASRWGLMGEPPLRPNDVLSFGYAFRFSAAKARDLLDWRATVAADAGVAASVDWYRRNVGSL